MTFGKVMGGGFPAAAFGGRAELMQNLAPVGAVYQAGTLSGNPVATAAGLTRRCGWPLRRSTQQIDRTAAQLQAEVEAALDAAGVPHVIQNAGNLFSVFFVAEGVTAVPDYATASRQSTAATRRSSIPCSLRASTCRRARTRLGFFPPRTMIEPWTGSSPRCRARPRPRGASG